MLTATAKQHHNGGKCWGRPFVKGQSGNPGGKSTNHAIVSAIAETLAPQNLLELNEIAHNLSVPASTRVRAIAIIEQSRTRGASRR